ncbi:MAG: hypothetical protein M3P22_01255 [bacterium]|nr:hypothetical protein [bacterium]
MNTENKNKKLWFKAKEYGWGWTPVSWEGWVVILIYLIIMIGAFRYFDQNSHSASDTLINFALPYVLGTIILFFICYKKGEKPKWQWGKKKDK